MAEHTIQTATLIRAGDLSAQTRHLEFEVSCSENFHFRPGQFVSVREPEKNGKQITRAYSIASPPRGDNHFELCLNRVVDGFMSNFLADLAVGQQIHWHGPHGLFTLHEPVMDSIFICTGTGVAPFRSMLHHIFSNPRYSAGREFWLFFGARHEQDLYYAHEFQNLERNHPNFHYLTTLSRPGPDWRGPKGYVQEHVRAMLNTVPGHGAGRMHAYICGLHEMVNENRSLLQELGWDRTGIFYERYD